MLNLDPTTLRFSRTKWISTRLHCTARSKSPHCQSSLKCLGVVVFGVLVLQCYSVWVWQHSGEKSLQEMLIPIHHTNTSLKHTNTSLNHTNTSLKQTNYSVEHKPHISTAYSLSSHMHNGLGCMKEQIFLISKDIFVIRYQI